MAVSSRKRKEEQFPSFGVKRSTRIYQSNIKKELKELATLDYTDPKKLEAFFQEYSSTTISLGSNGNKFTPWEGGSSDRAQFRLWECGNEYVNPPENLKVIGYLGHMEEDIVIMVGTQSGRVYMDEDEIVYIVADSLMEFAEQGCKKEPKFFDYYKARPNDKNSLPCAAGTVDDEVYDDMTTEITEDFGLTFIDHSNEELEADRKRVRQLHAEMGGFFKMISTGASGHHDNQETSEALDNACVHSEKESSSKGLPTENSIDPDNLQASGFQTYEDSALPVSVV